jgi:hypothetical protein
MDTTDIWLGMVTTHIWMNMVDKATEAITPKALKVAKETVVGE